MTPSELEEIRERAEKWRNHGFVTTTEAANDVARLLEYLEELRARNEELERVLETCQQIVRTERHALAPQGVNE